MILFRHSRHRDPVRGLYRSEQDRVTVWRESPMEPYQRLAKPALIYKRGTGQPSSPHLSPAFPANPHPSRSRGHTRVSSSLPFIFVGP
jgi:hypothetical protein